MTNERLVAALEKAGAIFRKSTTHKHSSGRVSTRYVSSVNRLENYGLSSDFWSYTIRQAAEWIRRAGV